MKEVLTNSFLGFPQAVDGTVILIYSRDLADNRPHLVPVVRIPFDERDFVSELRPAEPQLRDLAYQLRNTQEFGVCNTRAESLVQELKYW
jgi:hypothetical protein